MNRVFFPSAAAVAICVLATIAAPAIAETPTPPSHPIHLQLKWRHQFQFAGYYAAIEKGYFAAEGLTVDLIEGGAGTNGALDVSTGKADFAISSPSVLLERNRGLPVVAVAAVFQHSPLVLLVRRNSGFDTPQSLGGRRVMLGGRDGTDDSEILAMFAAEGMTKQPVVLLPHSGNFSDLMEGRVDAMSSYSTDIQETQKAGELLRPRQYGIDFYGDILITSLSLATNQPNMVRAFKRASLRGWQYALAHPEELTDLIRARYAPEESREHLLGEAAAMRELILPELVEIGHMNRGRWTHIGETYAMLGLLRPDWTLDRFLFSDIEEELHNSSNTWIMVGSIAGFALFLIAILLAGFVARLRILVHRRNRELAASEEQFRAIFDSVNDAIFLQAPEDGAILAVNQRMCELFGYRQEELLDLSIGDLGLDGKSGGRTDIGHWLAKARSDRPHLFEWRVRAKDGHGFWVEISLRQARIGGEDLLLVVARDISARKEVEEKLRRTIEDLVSSNSDLERFAYVSSHDLQTPLRNVVSYAQLLDRRYRGKLDADADEFIGFIVDNTRHMSELINDLLDYTRVGRPSLPLVPVDARRPVEQAVALLRPEIEACGAKIMVKEMPRVMADEAQMVSLMQNLIGNALKYRHPDRKPEIKIEAVPHLGAMWCFAVQDNGVGIEKQYFAKIFEIFQRLYPDHKSSGTGIGLALCQRIIHRFGGDIWVESIPGVGTTFLFTLPAAPEL
ncbi:ABC transporter substrate-binding protein [Magnetospirillum molischianum]|uniref:histidine kinase n=1 Tax=Magnetospirillum molischianum DSM 120 TaxID=1150626 RepID=H8FRE8_MAGML|nr:ABC transporter substrate-binding protein [Magnetospirillum molischianum]CCG40936.1 Putative two-component sensor histidine kinase, classical system [Magnetospirillum molischianum DSM 120]